MATSSITHNFVIRNKESAVKFVEVLDKSKIKKSTVDFRHISDTKEIKHLLDKCRNVGECENSDVIS